MTNTPTLGSKKFFIFFGHHFCTLKVCYSLAFQDKFGQIRFHQIINYSVVITPTLNATKQTIHFAIEKNAYIF